jgi:hypothetical protein
VASELPTDSGYSGNPPPAHGFTERIDVGTSYTIPAGRLDENTQYYWEVHGGRDGVGGYWSDVWSFTTEIQVPPAPNLTAPADQATGVSTTPTLDWDPAAGADAYRIVVSTVASELPTDPGYDGTPPPAHGFTQRIDVGTSYTIPAGRLDENTRYYWNVHGGRDTVGGYWSDVWSFTTEIQIPPAPNLRAPADQATGVSTTPTLDWDPAAGADAYRIVVSTVASELPTDPGYDGTPPPAHGFTQRIDMGTSYTIPAGRLDENTRYYWNVHGGRDTVGGYWSDVWSFTVTDSSPPADPPPLQVSFDSFNSDDPSTGKPPDPIGAAGPHHIVSVVNSSIAWHTKDGTLERQIPLGRSGGTIAGSFFETLDPQTPGFDPKIIYDDHAGRFVVVTLEKEDHGANDPANTSRILLAVSDDSDPNGTWHFQAIDAREIIGGNDHWVDYPGLSVCEEAIYVTGNMFTFGNKAHGATRFWIVEKASLYAGGTSSVARFDPVVEASIPDVIAPILEPAQMIGNGPAGVGTFLLGPGVEDVDGTDRLSVVRIDDPLTAPQWTHQYVTLGDIHDGHAIFVGATQPDSSVKIDTGGDNRVRQAVWRDGQLYAVNKVITNATPDFGQITAHWYRIDTNNLDHLTLADQGDIGAEDLGVATYTFYPAIAVDGDGNMGVVFSASGRDVYPGAYYTGRMATDPPGTVRSTATLAAGQDFYHNAKSGRNRWGDFGGMAIDPADDATFWGFHEYALPRDPDLAEEFSGRWGTRWGSFSFTASSPSPPGMPNLLGSADTGVSNNDELTNRDNSSADLALQFSVPGTVAGASVTVFAGDTTIGTAQATGTTTLVTTDGTVDLEDGDHLISAQQVVTGQTASGRSPSLEVHVDTVPPNAAIQNVDPNPRITPVDSLTFTFDEAVEGFDIDDVTLTRDGGSNLLTAAHQLTTGDNVSWILADTSDATGQSGSYRLALTAIDSEITDIAGNPLSADVDETWHMNTQSPSVTNVSSTTPDGVYGLGQAIDITVTWDEAVTVTGTPGVTLETGATDRQADYLSGSGTATLTFRYTVQAGDASPDLDYVGQNALALNGGTIEDAAGHDANLVLPAPGAPGSLSANKDLVVQALLENIIQVQLIAVDQPSATDERVPPTGISQAVVGSSYYVEIWVQQTVGSEGIVGGYVDVLFTPHDLVSYLGLDHGRIYTFFPGGEFQTPDLIDDIGGATFDSQIAVAPDWARFGVIQMDAAAAGEVTYSLEQGGQKFSLASLGNVEWEQVDLTDTAVVEQVTAAPTSLIVRSLVPTPSGFVARFNRPPDAADLNLYDFRISGVWQLGRADATLVRHLPDGSMENVAGSLVAGTNMVTFLATGGPLAAGNYTATLRSATDGFKDLTTGELLDGNADGAPGDDFLDTFTIDAAPTPVFSLPDFARGPGQGVVVPANAVGLPLRLSEARGVESVDVTIEYDPALLKVTGATVGPGMPAGASVVANTAVPGRVILSFSTLTELPSGAAEIVVLTAEVPSAAPYGAAHVLDITSVSINEDSIPATTEAAIHVAAFLGDTTGNGEDYPAHNPYSGLDAQRAARVAVELDQGFASFPAFDPLVIGDVTGNGKITGLDAQRIAQEAIGLDPWEIPPLPQPLRIEGLPAVADAVDSLTDRELTPIVNAAAARFEAVENGTAAIVRDVRFEIVDLPRDLLGMTHGQIIQIDMDAAGHGWFADATPWEDSEFSRFHNGGHELVSPSASQAQNRVDLLTVVMHELGHLLGYEHEFGGLMDDRLPLGTRRLPENMFGELMDDAAAVDDLLPHSHLDASQFDDVFASLGPP